MDKSYRIHTNILSDPMLQVDMRQDFDFLEVLSLKLRQKDAYRLHSSNYGVIVGRVLANDAFGIPNAKISVFIERDSNDSTDIESIYPYSDAISKDRDGRRYNLLPDYSDDDCYRIVGTFPNKRLMLDDDLQLEVYDKYWKYTTVTNNAGDYMLFAVPTGSVTVHVDLDLSDIGVLSQRPRDFEYKGYNLTMFDSPSQFKESTNIDSLAQIFSQNRSVFVYPFWGDEDNGIASLTRADVQIDYKFEPTCVFMGSIVADNEGHAIGSKCAPDVNNGMNNQLVGGSGTIEMIRKTTDDLVEEFQIQGNQLIDDNGVWCYQIPMNLDYVGTDEYGNIIPTDNPNKGIPTRARVRFRISKNDTGDEGFSNHTAKYLVPMNPIFDDKSDIPKTLESGVEVEKMYNFGSSTPISCFRDLYWNNVYSVKNYIPKVQVAHRAYSPNYGALKGSNFADDKNAIPFNKLNIHLPFTYIAICIIYSVVVYFVWFINTIIVCTIDTILGIINKIRDIKIPVIKVRPFKYIIPKMPIIPCIDLPFGDEGTTKVFIPGCWCKEGRDEVGCGKNGKKCMEGTKELIDLVQRSLATEYNVVRLDFYQDWLNGCLYMPLWYWKKRKKKTFLFGLFSRKAKNDYCSDDREYSRLKTYMGCNVGYSDNNLKTTNNTMPLGENRWHKRKKGQVRYRHGLIKPVLNKDGLTAYYYVGIQSTTDNPHSDRPISEIEDSFYGIRLYATDIILLGNLNEGNLYGIPQFYKCLPSTTVNLPPIATIAETESDEDEGENVDDTEDSLPESGTTIITGMDWGHDGANEAPNYKNGLFIDLSCAYVGTRAKSCINAERLSELGVILDMSYSMPYHANGDIMYGPIEPDGFINKLELDDTENRAMFATLNHIGFIPQEYQDINGLSFTTQVNDTNTNYIVPKFKYLYPVDFDGRSQIIMEANRNGFKQGLSDVSDSSYITFRMGADKDGKEGRKRHFYKKNGGTYSMPLYNNSYYFYFGIKKGSTAIDKFNEMFNATCAKQEKMPFTLDIASKGKSYCPSIYQSEDKGYGYIKLSSDDINKPYSYTLYDSYGNIVETSSDVSVNEVIIGGKSDFSLSNQEYTLDVMDADGKRVSEKIRLETSRIQANYMVKNLGTKYYDTVATTNEYICDKKNAFYGKIDLSGFTVDGYDCYITSSTEPTEIIGKDNNGNDVVSGYRVKIRGNELIEDGEAKTLNNGIEAFVDITSMEGAIEGCLCENVSFELESGESNIKTASWHIYKPIGYVMTITQVCDGKEIADNSTTSIVQVRNGEPFNTSLNEMPTRFMINNDSTVPSNFYSINLESNPTGNSISGWYGVHREDTYLFNKSVNTVTSANRKMWEDYVTLSEDINTKSSRASILMFKFNSLFSISKAVYVVNEGNNGFKLSSGGGNGIPLLRNISPYYSQADKMFTTYIFEDSPNVSYSVIAPNIIGFNDDIGENSIRDNSGPRWNPLYALSNNRGKWHVGNYFAGFTNNGGYISNKDIDQKQPVISSPDLAKINPHGSVKKLDTDIKIAANRLPESLYTANGGNRPWLRALNVDRRFDFDFTILAPISYSKFAMPKNKSGIDNLWKVSRLSGFTYNGIEMSYDEDYNVISADFNEETSAFTFNNELEYSYYYTSNENDDVKEAVTKFNENPKQVRRLYKNEFCDVDLRDFYWSESNKANIISLIDENSGNTIGDVYVFGYPSGSTELYNGDFSMTNYPTVRYIDVLNLSDNMFMYDYNSVSCSYDIDIEIDEDGVIKGQTMDGEETSFGFTFTSPIEFKASDEEDENYANIVFTTNGTVTMGSPRKFDASSSRLLFTYNDTEVDGFDVYARVPRLVKVLPQTDGFDGISYIKASQEWVKKDLDTAIKDVAPYVFNRAKDSIFHLIPKSVALPEGISLTDSYLTSKGVQVNTDGGWYFFMKDDEPLATSDNGFTDITFYIQGADLQGMTAFAILSDKECRSTDENALTKHLRLVEFSDIYYVGEFTMTASFVSENGTDAKQRLTITVDQNGIFSDTQDTEFIFTDKEGNAFGVNVQGQKGGNDKIIFELEWGKNEHDLLDKNVWDDEIPSMIRIVTLSQFTYRVDFKINVGR